MHIVIATIIWLIVFVGFSLVLALIILFTLKTSWRITGTITAIEAFTRSLKTKTDLSSKRALIETFSSNELFRRISRQYRKMEMAKKALAEKKLPQTQQARKRRSSQVGSVDY
mmetsp:Transcript_23885/g.29713  ORF Transcript_23885/g.29713 Transcript_23885/m.29713 type:complete len:113 (-) Transcript_23885:869-1207(-)